MSLTAAQKKRHITKLQNNPEYIKLWLNFTIRSTYASHANRLESGRREIARNPEAYNQRCGADDIYGDITLGKRNLKNVEAAFQMELQLIDKYLKDPVAFCTDKDGPNIHQLPNMDMSGHCGGKQVAKIVNAFPKEQIDPKYHKYLIDGIDDYGPYSIEGRKNKKKQK